MKAFGIAALVVALAGPAAAQQTQQPNQPRQDTTTGAAQDMPQNGRSTPNENPTPQQNQGAGDRQGDRGVAGTSGQNDSTAAGRTQQNNSELPATASPLVLIGVLGLLSFGGAALARRMRTRTR